MRRAGQECSGLMAVIRAVLLAAAVLISAGAFVRGSAASVSAATDFIPLYRMYNRKTGEHLYTKDVNEKNVLRGSRIWNFEGIAWYSPASSSRPVYRVFNPETGEHLYTMDSHEKKVLTSEHQWKDEGVAWYSDDQKRVPVYRLFNRFGKGVDAHLNTLDEAEKGSLISRYHWKDEGIAFYAASEKSGYHLTDSEKTDAGDFYASISSDVTLNGTGDGYHAKIVLHTNNPDYNAVSFGIQYDNGMDVNGRAINHTAYLLENVDGSGQTAPRYTFYTGEEIGIIPEVGNTYHLQLTWKNNVVTYYVNGHKLGSQDARMGRTFIMQVEGSCKHDGDTIDATFDNVKVAVGDSEVTWGTYQDWGTIEENFGLKIRTTKDGVAVDSGPSFTSGETSYGQCFEIYGRASVPAGVDWDSAEKKTGRVLSALAMLPQNGEKARQEEEAAKNNGGKPSGSDTGSSTSSDSGSSSTSSGSGGTEQPSAGGETGGGTSSGGGTSTETGGGTSSGSGTSAGSGSGSTSSGSGSGSTSSGSGTGSATSGSGTTENPSSAGDSTGGSEDTAA